IALWDIVHYYVHLFCFCADLFESLRNSMNEFLFLFYGSSFPHLNYNYWHTLSPPHSTSWVSRFQEKSSSDLLLSWNAVPFLRTTQVNNDQFSAYYTNHQQQNGRSVRE